MRIIYYCPAVQSPTGGITVMYRHCARLNAIGVDARILPSVVGYEYKWAKHSATIISDKELRPDDVIVVPDVCAATVGKLLVAARMRYAIFVQNGYLVRNKGEHDTDGDIESAYTNASCILSISDDTSRLIRTYFPYVASKIVSLSWSIDFELFFPYVHKDNVITYMPRKLTDHSAAVIFGLGRLLPTGWKTHAIHGVNEAGVAVALRRSKIFLSFSHLEGCPLPPAEAALCGNYVIGYHGEGARGYWSNPNFCEVYPGDIYGCLQQILSRVNAIQSNPTASTEELLPGIHALKRMFSVDNEIVRLREFCSIAMLDQPRSDQSNACNSQPVIMLQERVKLRLRLRAKRREWRTKHKDIRRSGAIA